VYISYGRTSPLTKLIKLFVTYRPFTSKLLHKDKQRDLQSFLCNSIHFHNLQDKINYYKN